VRYAVLIVCLLAATQMSAAVPQAAEVLGRYNETVRAAMSEIDSLSVRQVVIEPCDDGEDRTAVAVLTYVRGEKLRRDVLESDLRYPSGEYRLESLVGPLVLTGEYSVDVVGEEEMDGEACLRLELTALVRDVDHFDGTLWLSSVDGGPVRIQGAVADPPFPAREILLDKSFALVGGRFRLVSRHTGEVEVGLLLGSTRGVRHIFYEEYSIRASSAR
jgi:hypothetical protein